MEGKPPNFKLLPQDFKWPCGITNGKAIFKNGKIRRFEIKIISLPSLSVALGSVAIHLDW
jgi:hypothetical protein